MWRKIIFLILFFCYNNSHSSEEFFLMLKNSKVNVRMGPGMDYPIKFIYKKKYLPVKIIGSKFLRPIEYSEKLGSAQCKSAVMLAALKTPGITKIKAKKSRNHTELLFNYLKIPIKVSKKKSILS